MVPSAWLRRLPDGHDSESVVAGAREVKTWAFWDPEAQELESSKSKTSWHMLELYWVSRMKVTSVVVSLPPFVGWRDTRPREV